MHGRLLKQNTDTVDSVQERQESNMWLCTYPHISFFSISDNPTFSRKHLRPAGQPAYWPCGVQASWHAHNR